MRVVILGCGGMGSALARTLDEEGHEACVIDYKPEAFKQLGDQFGGRTTLGWGLDTDVLVQAGIEQADAFAAVTEGDNRNIMSALMAREEFGVPEVVVRLYNPRRAEIYSNYNGIKTICTTTLGAQRIHNTIVKNEALSSLAVGDGKYQVLEMVVGKTVRGKKIRALPLPEDAIVSALIRRGVASVPLSDTVIEDGDRLIVLATPSASERVQAVFAEEG